jgi:lipopolysaccharide biosynthesis protein
MTAEPAPARPDDKRCAGGPTGFAGAWPGRLARAARQAILAVCLLPAASLRYESLGDVWRGLARPRTFFQDLADQIGALAALSRQRGGCRRWAVGPFLAVAEALLDRRGWRSALRRALPARLRRVAVRLGLTAFPPPGPIAWGNAPAPATPPPPSWPMDQGAARLLYGGGADFAGAAVAVVAHWDPQGRVDPYVIRQCRQLKEDGFRVVLASGRLSPDLPAPDGWADAVVVRDCPGYDFASWRAALLVLPALWRSAELALCNDSVFGGVGSYAPMHKAMARVDCDFWGVAESRELAPHLQSYHVVFRPPALASQALADFFDRVPLTDDRQTAVACEVRLTRELVRAGLRPAAFAPFPPGARGDLNPSCELWRELLEAGAPLLKRELLLRNDRGVSLAGWTDQLAGAGYPLELVVAYCNRLGLDPTPALDAAVGAAVWPPHVQAWRRPLPEAGPGGPSPDALSVGAFVHVHYLETADQLLACVARLPERTRIFVSTDEAAKKDVLDAKLDKVGLAGRADVRTFPNVGWDVAPFLVGFAREIAACDVLLRLHSKRSLHLPPGQGDAWRDLLCGALAGSRERADRILRMFARDPGLGMIAPPLLPAYADSLRPGSNLAAMRRLLAGHGAALTAQTPIDYPMGSMFWCRSRALAPWLGLDFADFAPTSQANRDGDLAHALERLFFFGCALEGLGFARLPASGEAGA